MVQTKIDTNLNKSLTDVLRDRLRKNLLIKSKTTSSLFAMETTFNAKSIAKLQPPK